MSLHRSHLRLVSVLALAGLSACGSRTPTWAERSAPPRPGQEATPEELEAALHLELATNPDVTLERPLALTRNPRVQVEVFKTPPPELGIPYEFIVITVDGILRSVRITSTATLLPYRGEMKTTIEGTYPLSILRVRGKPYPWKRSKSYEDSPMFWGLHIDGGYWIHATPHYGELGRPASMGCIRLNYPTAMELFDLVVNQARGDAQITIHPPKSAAWALRRVPMTPAAIRMLLEEDRRDAHIVTRGDFEGYAHVRRNQKQWLPKCGDVDCLEYFGPPPPPAPPAPVPTTEPAPAPPATTPALVEVP